MDFSSTRDHLRKQGPLKAESFRHVALERDGVVLSVAVAEVRGVPTTAVMAKVGDGLSLNPRQALQLSAELTNPIVLVGETLVLRAISATARLTPEGLDALIASVVAEAKVVHAWLAARRPATTPAPGSAVAEIWAA
jgi:hypothetical protein